MTVAIVAEGGTDHLLIQAVILRLFPGEHRFLPLQPSDTVRETGGGWKGVRRWCRQRWQPPGPTLEQLMSAETGDPIDLLVIHIDADVILEHDLQEGVPDPIAIPDPVCPPIGITHETLTQVLLRWLNREELPRGIVVMIPGQDGENWIFAALFPEHELCSRTDFECTRSGNQHPGFLLSLREYGRHFTRPGGVLKKPRRVYSVLALNVAESWDVVCHVCSQARRFTEHLSSVSAS